MAEEKKEAAPKKEAEGKKAGTRRPTALKRDIQSAKKNLLNRAYKAKVKTAMTSLKDSLSKKEGAEALKPKLRLLNSLMDKGVKKGIFKKNKAARTKSRLYHSVKGNA